MSSRTRDNVLSLTHPIYFFSSKYWIIDSDNCRKPTFWGFLDILCLLWSASLNPLLHLHTQHRPGTERRSLLCQSWIDTASPRNQRPWTCPNPWWASAALKDSHSTRRSVWLSCKLFCPSCAVLLLMGKWGDSAGGCTNPVVLSSLRVKYLSTELQNRGISLREVGCNISLYIAKMPSL